MSKLHLSKLVLGILLNAAVDFLTRTEHNGESADPRHTASTSFSKPSNMMKKGEYDMVSTTNNVRMGSGMLIAGALGAVVGAALALIYAPQTGKKTQAAIKREANQLKKQVGKRAGTLYSAAEGLASDAADRISSLTENGRDFVEERADNLKKVLTR